MYSLVDLIIILINMTLIFDTSFNGSLDTISKRQFEAILMVLLWFKSLYYLGLIGKIAPLIDIIFTIISDIKYFMIVYLICMIAFINAFQIIGKNQLELGTENVPYATWVEAMHHVYMASLGEFETEAYFQDSQ